MPNQRILVLFNEPVLPAGHPDAESEHEVLFVAEVVAKILSEAGFDVGRLGVGQDAATLLSELRTRRPDAVFNLYEGLASDGNTEACIAGLLELEGIPFTGSPSSAMHLARNKILTKYLLQGAGLPTPEFQVVDRLPLEQEPSHWPVIVKPALQDASVGIDQGSVVSRADRLTERILYLLQHYGQPVLVERYVPGREFNVSVIETGPGLRVLPLCEIKFAPDEPSHWPIVTYAAKWHTGSREDLATPPYFPAEVEPALARQLEDLAQRAFRLVGCRDYARVDFRVGPTGRPSIIEVNPNPCINPQAGLAAAVAASGQTHAQFIVAVTRAALARRELQIADCRLQIADSG